MNMGQIELVQTCTSQLAGEEVEEVELSLGSFREACRHTTVSTGTMSSIVFARV